MQQYTIRTHVHILAHYSLHAIQKEYTIQVPLTVAGNIIEYQGEVTTKTADITTSEIHINSVIST